MMKEACEKRTTNILDIPGKKYAFDSTTIPLCLATFPWAKFRRKKGGIKAHVLYDIEAQVPAFYTVTTASKHDSTAMSSISCEPNAYYVFDRAYDSFRELYRIHLTESFFVVRAKTNLKYKIVWPLSHTVSWLLSNMICDWNARPMRSCKFLASH
jgi:transposase